MAMKDSVSVRARVYSTTASPCTGYTTSFVTVPVGPRDPKLISCKLLNIVLDKGIYEVTFTRVGDVE